MKFKIGQKITINFHCAGVVSQEQLKIIDIQGDVLITDETFNGDNGEEKRKFNSITGKCLNDSNYFGSKRTIEMK